jgi:hypothetical protein
MANTVETRQKFIQDLKTIPFKNPYYHYKSNPSENIIYCSYDNLQGTLYDFSLRNRYLAPQTEEITGRWDRPFSETENSDGKTTTIFNFNLLKPQPTQQQINQIKEEANLIVNELIDLWITTDENGLELDLNQIKPKSDILSETPLYQLIITELTLRNIKITPIDKSGLKFKIKNYIVNEYKQ